MSKHLKFLGAGLVALAVIYFLSLHFSVGEVKAFIQTKVDGLETVLLEAGIWGPIYVFCLYFLSTIFFLPLWGFHITCGYVYGTATAATIIIFTQTISATAAFSLSRYFFRSWTTDFFNNKYGEKFRLIDAAIGSGGNGLKIITLLRLSPIVPFGLNNYLCGATNMKLWEFAIGTFLGILPGTTAYCYVGATGKVVSEGISGLQSTLLVCGIGAALYLVYFLNQLATETLRKAGVQ